MKNLVAFFLLILIAGTSGRHINLTQINREVSGNGNVLNEAIIDYPFAKSREDHFGHLKDQQPFGGDSFRPDKQFGNGGFLQNLWDRLTGRNRNPLLNFFRRQNNLLLHAASFGTSIAALSTAIALGSTAVHTAGNHLHEVELNNEFVLEPVFHGKSDVHGKRLVDRVFGTAS